MKRIFLLRKLQLCMKAAGTISCFFGVSANDEIVGLNAVFFLSMLVGQGSSHKPTRLAIIVIYGDPFSVVYETYMQQLNESRRVKMYWKPVKEHAQC